ncbi:MAG: DUF4382 domain-containing protein [Planctomycetota bacterium]
MRRRVSPVFLLLAATWPAAACNNGSNGGTGEVSIVLTDAASDELVQFEVDVANIVLTKASGDTVSVMPRAARIDFADLTTVGELVTAVTLESGTYRSMTMDLDFSSAAVAIVGQTSPAAVVDTAGNPITGTVSVQVDFSVRARPLVRVARHHLFQLDLDLDQGVTVNAGINTVTFAPVLSAVLDPSNPRPVVASAVLAGVDAAAGTFTVDRKALDGNTLATVVVRTGALTVFQVDGQVALGASGLAQLAAHTGERVFVQGTLDPRERVLVAAAVETGAGVPGNGQDWVLGHVTARNTGAGTDPTLTVTGRSFDVGTSTRRFNAAHTVTLARASTKVLRRGAGNSLDSDALNVGQLVWVFGDMTGTAMDATAATGVVRMLPTSVFGIAAGPAAGGVLTLDVARFDLRPDSAFNFVVGGNSQALENAFTVDVDGLDTTGITTGSRLRVFAWINPVDVGTDSNCEALSIVDRTSEGRALLLQWSPASGAAIASSTPSALTLDVSGAAIATVGDGFAPVAVGASPAPTLVPLLGLGVYRIVQAGQVDVFFTFDAFRAELVLRSGSVFRIGAFGTYDDGAQAFSALAATIVLE